MRTITTVVFFTVLFSFSLALAAKKPKLTALELQCESFKDPHDKLICLKAQNIELQEKTRKLERETVRAEPDSMKKARKQEESASKKQVNAEKNAREAYARVQITGCPDGSVIIDSRIGQRSYGFVNVRYTVINTNTVPIDEIRDDVDGRVVVQHLCPGGRLTITKVMPIWLDGNQVPVSYTAIGHLGGKVAISHSQQTYLNVSQAQYQATSLVLWDIRLQPQY